METKTNPAQPTKRRKKKRPIDILIDILIPIVLLIGVGLMLYPTISNKWNEMHQSRAIAGYTQAVNEMGQADYTAMMDAAKAYNEALKSNPDRFTPTEEESKYYRTLLDVQGNGIMGYVEIPAIKVKLPIYHGTDEAVLQVGAGHLEGSSLPIGGPGTHVAISGHRGLTSATLFSNLNKLVVGDEFYLHVLGETMCYQVREVNTVLPDEMELLGIDEERDRCTLITCTPYGVNSHRLLVQGERVEYEPQPDSSESAAASSKKA